MIIFLRRWARQDESFNCPPTFLTLFFRNLSEKTDKSFLIVFQIDYFINISSFYFRFLFVNKAYFQKKKTRFLVLVTNDGKNENFTGIFHKQLRSIPLEYYEEARVKRSAQIARKTEKTA